jgi:3-deoxy-D-manno-octulosonic-acid transferase
MDTPSNARRFVSMVQPKLAVFIKYEFWYYYLKHLEARDVPILMISCIFRENQLFFHPVGRFYHKALKRISHFFVQDEKSQRLIGDIGIKNTTVGGDTRFDRVVSIAREARRIEVAEEFIGTERVMVLGSTWPSCMEVLHGFIEHYKERLKFIIAPHNISEPEIEKLEADFEHTIRYSQATGADLTTPRILIIDNIGMLSSLYRYGHFAYVGGGFRGALHNTLEAAVYGIPVFFGEHINNQKFIEAIELVEHGGAYSFRSTEELELRFQRLFENDVSYRRVAGAAEAFVESRTGATEKVMNQILKRL